MTGMNVSGQAAEPAAATGLKAPETEAVEQGENPNEIRRGVRMGGQDGKSRDQIIFERLIGKVEPSMKGDPAHLKMYTDLFERELIHDVRMFPVKVEGTAAPDGTIVLNGYVPYEESKEALGKLFKYLGFENVSNDVEVLPSAELGDKKFGLVIVPRAFSYDAATEPRETMTQSFLGDPIFLLRKDENDHYLVQTSEGYVSHLAASAVLPVDAATFANYQSGAQAYVLADVKQDGRVIPQGARLKVVAEAADAVTVALPDGQQVKLARKVVELRDGKPNPRAIAALTAARQLLGSLYVWGGKGSEGVDCSGLVQCAWKSQGVNLARDAYQQSYSGNLVATRWYPQGMRMGDLMYFAGYNGKIQHTAIYVGEGRFIEASDYVRYTSLNPGDANYDEKRAKGFAFAKRILE